MVGAAPIVDAVLGKRAKALLAQLLQQRLVVLAVAGDHVVELLGEGALDEPLGGAQSGVEIAGADERFQRVRQQGALAAAAGALLTAAEQQMPVDRNLPGDPRQALLAHHHRLDARQVSFRPAVEPAVDPLADHQSQHRVAQELEPLVACRAGLGGMGAVTEGHVQEPLIAEANPDPSLQGTQIGATGRRYRCKDLYVTNST